MEQFNKAISFVLGLIVVVIFLAVATGKINLKGTKLPFSKGATPTGKSIVTPSPKAPLSGQTSYTQKNNVIPTTKPSSDAFNRRYNTTTPSTIPSTGPALLLPLAVSSLLGGSFLRRMGKKK
ncbi:hypothetical protein A2334_01600 [Candidatus Roizmanbacteria bacterium RIFOXYB2_FULL_38_10]|uniref:Uncharacterized protein n=1 Tax=Candidatus Roizmanbacteria bacterium RIFOXYD1_FULL_38_12 TaxID=1802093 RepID=A0A1F7L2C6_9BACT|nr:MAG: hypothetical protein A3K47_05460 [Candidatus Roizmanbacteria bacterium RIFOXYA2_FULL_38_14]OGK64191.1 MAG: hypothetical protein A3K27_05460 [Candidatus Roizmanbacteria bacterium RIFOXYA1_FULL_37_12]OGK66037.1 MAG: hypothetical protein A3K38_05460 [Candidatus Roizmanbacteria bacterium RIFOXYB1_FULL_40_23]OGK68544.1 MAG: hypothetical protein A2334_01600 [Candidatus Roizmanbacteria bacterium RIFOXYB2_FULL_38_10]OGK70442.1 MAG: hypothetical protein A3K21_05465 [Candidatus Roizmanbacteria ba